MQNTYLPEGSLLYTHENRTYLSNIQNLERAMSEGKILEGMAVLCDEDLTLHVDLNGIDGIIKKEDSVYTKDNEEIKDIAIITRVGKPVAFKVIAIEEYENKKRVILSRRLAQIECMNYYISSLIQGDIIGATITHLENFGAFVDIGCGIISLLSIDCISVSRISHPKDRLYVGQRLYVVVKSISEDFYRVYVSLKELLGTWEENAQNFSVGQTVGGIVRSIEDYGVFIELTPNLAGLAEIKECGTFDNDLVEGQSVAVYIKNIIPERMKIKLVLIDSSYRFPQRTPIKYYTDVENVNHIDYFRYSPDTSRRIIETDFSV